MFQKMQDLISRCWSEKPNERPSFEEIFNELASDFNCLGEKVDEEEVQKYISMLEKNQSPGINSDLIKRKILIVIIFLMNYSLNLFTIFMEANMI